MKVEEPVSEAHPGMEEPFTSNSIIQPVYMAMCTASSMASNIESMSEILIGTLDEISASPVVADFVRLAALAFADRAELLFPLSDPFRIRTIPRLHAGGTSQYGPVFRTLMTMYQEDRRVLSTEGARLRRPIIIIFPGGQPRDKNWRAEYQELASAARPRIYAVQLDGPSAPAIEAVADQTAHIHRPQDATRLVSTVLESLTYSYSVNDRPKVVERIFREFGSN